MIDSSWERDRLSVFTSTPFQTRLICCHTETKKLDDTATLTYDYTETSTEPFMKKAVSCSRQEVDLWAVMILLNHIFLTFVRFCMNLVHLFAPRRFTLNRDVMLRWDPSLPSDNSHVDYYKLMQDFTEPDVSIQFEVIMKRLRTFSNVMLRGNSSVDTSHPFRLLKFTTHCLSCFLFPELTMTRLHITTVTRWSYMNKICIVHDFHISVRRVVANKSFK